MTSPAPESLPPFEDVCAALHRGDFSRLVNVFENDPADASLIAQWVRDHRFAADISALNEAASCACFLDRTAMVEFLIDHGAEPVAGAGRGLNGFHWAANRGQLQTVHALIARGLPLETRNAFGGTVLGATVWASVHEARDTHPAIIEALLAAGADVSEAEYPSGSAIVGRLLERYGAVEN